VKTDYINTYSPYGLSLEGIDFLSVMQRMGGENSLKDWENYNLAASMIRQGKFNPPDAKGRPIISDYTYGYQVDTELFTLNAVILTKTNMAQSSFNLVKL